MPAMVRQTINDLSPLHSQRLEETLLQKPLIGGARALLDHSALDASEIVRAALSIAAQIDIYTNTNITVEELEC